MNTKEKEKQQEQLEKMIKDARWAIDYHTQKLEEAKITLQLLIN